jgi:hypothetical protein
MIFFHGTAANWVSGLSIAGWNSHRDLKTAETGFDGVH